MTELASLPFNASLRVSEVTRYIKELVERDDVLATLSVRGELSDFSRSANGHYYFTLKDSASQISCVLFRREALQHRNDLQSLRRGMAVVVMGFLSVYEPRGTYQICVEHIVPQGEGALFQRVERLKAQLEAEGLFAMERKRPLPPFPKTIALITSPGSQAYHDVLHRLRTQYPFVTVIEAGASVQGTGAADEMALAIDIVNRLTDAEAILLVRGGGAPEELAAFNEERLARAIFASRVPIVTGIGHETDYTIADYVADLRAATPSLAAAACVPDTAGLVQSIGHLHRQLSQSIGGRVRADRRRWVALNRALLATSPENRLRARRQRQDELAGSMERAVQGHLHSKRMHLEALSGQLRALDPLAILQRGYAVLEDEETAQVVARHDQATPGRRLRARVADGTFSVVVERK